MHEPTPEQYNPPLEWRGHALRTAGMISISAVLWPATAKVQLHDMRWLFWLDLGVGLVCFVLSFFRRRWPFTVALLTSLGGFVSISSAGPSVLAAVSLATRRVVWQLIVVGILGLLGSAVFTLLGASPDNNPWWVDLGFGLAFTIAMLVSGMYVGSRRELLWTLRDRAERAEAEQELRVEQGRSNERARIAREMHDVLAHRISLITMHAGAMAYRTDLSADEMREAAEVVQAKSHEALTDLRAVLGVLREDDAGALRERPQPTFGDLAALVAEAETSGMHVAYDEHVHESTRMPDQVGRTTYRIVQEGLTNARKHAPGVTVVVKVAGSPDEGVDIRIRNAARANGVSRTPGAGLGLVGLVERAKLAGGRLESRRDGGTFELHGWLPWTT